MVILYDLQRIADCNMKNWMEEYGLLQPDYKESQALFITVLRRPPISAEINGGQIGGQKSGQIGGQKKWSELSERQRSIINRIKNDQKISRKEISNYLGINQSAVQKHLQKLKQQGMIKRTGPAKGGVWEILIDI